MVGRNVGYRKPKEKYLNEYRFEIKMLANGLSLREVSKITGRSVNTLRKIKQYI